MDLKTKKIIFWSVAITLILVSLLLLYIKTNDVGLSIFTTVLLGSMPLIILYRVVFGKIRLHSLNQMEPAAPIWFFLITFMLVLMSFIMISNSIFPTQIQSMTGIKDDCEYLRFIVRIYNLIFLFALSVLLFKLFWKYLFEFSIKDFFKFMFKEDEK